jgi:hypothetical protein
MSQTAAQKAKRMAVMLLEANSQITTEDVVGAVDQVLTLLPGAAADREQLIRDVEAACNVYVPGPTALDGRDDHVEWLPDRRGEIDWKLWHRYQQYLEDEKGWVPQATYRLDDVTDHILRRLENPKRPGRWDRRGMVVGHVQSGKTANYTGLICKAADAGYKLIIVLAGTMDSLRSQTQLRLDEGFLGYDTQKRMLFDKENTRLGVGLLPGVDFYHVNSLTSSEQKGDFKKQIASSASLTIGGADPLLLVVKKNKSILNNLISWLRSAQQETQHGETKARVPRVPMLIVDDECDNASVNTKDTFDTSGVFDPDVDPTAINGCIRRLLDSFDQAAYVGYTATPFANIFIFKKAETEEYGEDLFPRSFIINLKKSSDYIGAAKVFGLEADPGSGIEGVDAYPITRTVEDADVWMPSDHRNGYAVPQELPESLRQAVLGFILVCAARHARGQTAEHNSMLIHVTRFVAVQQQVAELVGAELAYTKDRLEFGDGGKGRRLIAELESLWKNDFVPTSAIFSDETLIDVSWDQVRSALRSAAAKIEINIVNGSSKDALEYFGKPNGVSVIAIGGAKLSRGLTLEGLSVSYYLRTSRMYDTLLQMGRWFGFRPGYADLCRLYTTAELQRWYKDITLANEELLLQFDEMALTGGTPEDFGLRVRTSPDGLMITAAAKIRSGTAMRLSFSGSISETILFKRDASSIASNLQATEKFVKLLQATATRRRSGDTDTDDGGDNLVWEGVDGYAVAEFLDEFSTHKGATKAQSRVMAKYIRLRLDGDPAELTSWTVALMSNPGPKRWVAGLKVGCTKRSKFKFPDRVLDSDYSIRRLVSPSDEKIDLTEDQRTAALQQTIRLWEKGATKSKKDTPPDLPGGPSIRRARPKDRGLLLIYLLDPLSAELEETSDPIVGLAVSFPYSDNADAIEYMINNTYWEQELGLE